MLQITGYDVVTGNHLLRRRNDRKHGQLGLQTNGLTIFWSKGCVQCSDDLHFFRFSVKKLTTCCTLL